MVQVVLYQVQSLHLYREKPAKKSCELGIKYVNSAIKQTQIMEEVMVQLTISLL